ncbi:extracellular solute-binding protein [Paenibacillus ginsengarvi]|uniref:Extracellular solute-binding protein n=1 Tax=Paenibacillus ginsengarvi TaxID=400777 RepID=A0A3B0BT29_9BACL|nr:extracellular solute-binding protein [Paenibacillus ginsengarvi]RKN76010.1 extracellular solute-binding protein [Paenibacillus ginsengarvi]
MNSTRSNEKPFRLTDMTKQLRDDIVLRGKYAPGEFLPSELALVGQFGLSNKTVRKGLDQLAAEGLIEKIPRVGTRVIAGAAKPDTVTLRLGSMHSLERDMLLSQLIAEFEAANPDIRIETVKFHSDYYAGAIEAHLNAGLVDALMINDELFWQISENSRDIPLEPQVVREGTYSFLNESFSCKRTLYVRPLVFTPVILAYNKDHFREAGVPEPDGSWTWDDAIRHAIRLSMPGKRYGLCFYPLSNNRWPVFLLQSGDTFAADNSGRFRLEGTKLPDSIRLYKSIIRNRDFFPDHLAESSRDIAALFRKGHASMIMTTYNSLNDFATASGLHYDISAVPYRGEARTLLTTIGISVNKRSGNKEAAGRLVDFLASEHAQRFIRKRTLTLPAMRKAADHPISEDDSLNRPSRFHLYRNIVPGYRRYRDLGLPPESFLALRELLKLYGSGLIEEQSLSDQLAELASGPASAESGDV